MAMVAVILVTGVEMSVLYCNTCHGESGHDFVDDDKQKAAAAAPVMSRK